ncbi:MAG: hypothetical protein ACYYNF_00735 [Actinomycetes bacterium]|nr:hypothetical protein [Candidatus Nanopelagicales bacterium]MDP4825952.1 hypothetical protein [Candidatus Nanopelagicales bacterium]MDP4888812.1 hypothetical protein [Candidatus Nanopelagicales bacterium]
MNLILGPIIAAVVGAIVAGGAAFGIVSSQTAVPSPVDAPFVVYGTN